jgi:hypothetical protein
MVDESPLVLDVNCRGNYVPIGTDYQSYKITCNLH